MTALLTRPTGDVPDLALPSDHSNLPVSGSDNGSDSLGGAVGKAARAALTTASYLSARSGPNLGVCLPGINFEVGRNSFLIDRQLSRLHFGLNISGRVLRVRDLGSTNGTKTGSFPVFMRKVRGEPRPLKRFVRAGRGLWRKCRRPAHLQVPPILAAEKRPRSWLSIIPLAISIPLMVAFRPWIALPLVSVLASVAFTLWIRKRGSLHPDTVLLAVAAGTLLDKGVNDGPARQVPGGVGAWLSRGRWRRPALKLLKNERVALSGSGARQALRWWLAQVLASGNVTVLYRGKRLGSGPFVIEVIDCDTNLAVLPDSAEVSAVEGSKSGEAHAWIGVSPSGIFPAWAQKVVFTRPKNRLLRKRELPSSHWWEGICWLTETRDGPSEQANLPAVALAPHHDEHWSHQALELPVPIGVCAAGTYTLDLVTQGPHALVAGTTGAGKSEFLVTWILQLATRFSPAALNFVLVDFKGGSAFGPLADLPHTTGMLTDLDYQSTSRALSSLRAELKSRERLFASRGFRDYQQAAATGDAPARLVVVIDEFRELGTAHPELLDELTSLATLGRSLGVHLVLATQRPAGIVDSQIRANMNLRVCLRVLSATDSTDVLGKSGAESLPAIAGRGLVATDTTTAVQFFWHRDPQKIVSRIKDLWPKGEATTKPWLPELPNRIFDYEVKADYPRRVGSGSLVEVGQKDAVFDPDLPLLGLGDYPENQLQAPLNWDSASPLFIVGATGSGKTWAAAALTKQLSTSRPVVFVGTNPAPELKQYATVVSTSQSRLCSRVLELALRGKIRALIVDDVEAFLAVFESGRNWQALTRWEDLVRTAGSRDLKLVLTASPLSTQSRWSTPITSRLVLALRDRVQCSQLGLSEAHSQITVPGRGCLYRGGTATWLQVSIDTSPATFPTPILQELPFPFKTANKSVIGAFGDCRHELQIDNANYLVLGKSGSGRTQALRRLKLANPDLLIFDDFEASSPAESELTQALAQGSKVAVATLPATLRRLYGGPLLDLLEKAQIIVLGNEAAKAGATIPALADFNDQQTDRELPAGRGWIRVKGTVEPIQISS